MDILPPTQIHLALALQTLSIPSTLLLCLTSMLRERSIGSQDEKRLIQLYKQHAFALELVQLCVILLAFGLMAGNTVAAFEARALVIRFASEDISSFIVHSALLRNGWLLLSAICNLAAVNMLDSWSVPLSLREFTDPLFRLTRESIRDYIKSRKEEEYRPFNEEFLLAAIHYPNTPTELQLPTKATPKISKPSTPLSASEPFENPILNATHRSQTDLTQSSPAITSAPPSPPPPLPPFLTSQTSPTTSHCLPSPPPPPSYAHPTVSSLRRSTHRPPKPKLHSPAKRSLSKSPSPTKARKKRSVTFAREEVCYYFQEEEREGQGGEEERERGDGEGEGEVRVKGVEREIGVRDIVRELERGLMGGREGMVEMAVAV